MEYKDRRKKAFLGLAIGGLSLLSSVAGGIASRNAEERRAKAIEEANERERRINGFQEANNYSSALANVANNQDYMKELQSRVVYRGGGRKKFEIGGKTKLGAGDYLSGISSIVDLGFSLYNAFNPIKQPILEKYVAKDNYNFGVKNDIDNNSYDNVYDNQSPIIHTPTGFKDLTSLRRPTAMLGKRLYRAYLLNS